MSTDALFIIILLTVYTFLVIAVICYRCFSSYRREYDYDDAELYNEDGGDDEIGGDNINCQGIFDSGSALSKREALIQDALVTKTAGYCILDIMDTDMESNCKSSNDNNDHKKKDKDVQQENQSSPFFLPSNKNTKAILNLNELECNSESNNSTTIEWQHSRNNEDNNNIALHQLQPQQRQECYICFESFVPGESVSWSKIGNDYALALTETESKSKCSPSKSKSKLKIKSKLFTAMMMEKYNHEHLFCKHVYHTSCITKWLRHHDECPCCRRNIIKSVKGRGKANRGRRGSRHSISRGTREERSNGSRRTARQSVDRRTWMDSLHLPWIQSRGCTNNDTATRGNEDGNHNDAAFDNEDTNAHNSRSCFCIIHGLVMYDSTGITNQNQCNIQQANLDYAQEPLNQCHDVDGDD